MKFYLKTAMDQPQHIKTQTSIINEKKNDSSIESNKTQNSLLSK